MPFHLLTEAAGETTRFVSAFDGQGLADGLDADLESTGSTSMKSAVMGAY
uniref:Uncharacterized protein n=1 Tax=Picea glauca TaxID=3330 RepID=A0A101M0G0_PICGL|nr:hypothetical protein ABT39_MTgene4719 [Picea glauca]QHR91295.1 hypothetical protein Q903MT_gene5327 [Picea sitchensis]